MLISFKFLGGGDLVVKIPSYQAKDQKGISSSSTTTKLPLFGNLLLKLVSSDVIVSRLGYRNFLLLLTAFT